MDATKFVAPDWGRAVSTGGSAAYHAFVPASLPRKLTLKPDTIMLLSDADAALGRLAGSGRLLPDPHLLVNAYITREAVASSRIEGTQASVTEIFDAAVTDKSPRADVQEVRNYIRALEHGVSRLGDGFPISLRLIREMHDLLLTGVRGHERTPGHFRQSQNWISSPDNRPSTARFVPPTVEEMWKALDDWEKYLHDEQPKLPLLIRCALLHYQFETIHPFLDGNGRLGRLFIVLYLVTTSRLPTPLLYISSYFDQRKGEYYDRLQFVRERGEIDQWLDFFLAGVAVQAADAINRAEELADLREQYRLRLQGSRSRAIEVVDLLFANPVLTVKAVQRRLGMSQPGATNLLRTLATADIVTEVGEGPGTRHRWFGDDILRVLDPQPPARES
ncbi:MULTISPECIES: Fic family protein [unclassified Mycobacterium]|uniref:Fic family protein n=1 Tax=unclassified Mycobacterium TaxID=2642494 RepID=UPI0029C794D4|nr:MULTISPECIES: Fic family protein [unclassified Mycobacterium]